MSLSLRPYQAQLLEEARAALKRHRSVVVQLPTGGGKTALATHMLAGVAERGRTGNFIVHRQELVDQTARTFEAFGIPYGIVSAGYAPNPYQPIQICSIDTLRARLIAGKPVAAPSLNVWDECHHSAAEGWQKVKAHFAGALDVGLTATPERLDGKGLDGLFAALVIGPSVASLIAQGFLADYRAFAPSVPDVSRVTTRLGDLAKGELAYVMDRPSITGDAVGHYLSLARGKRALAFCVSVAHSLHVVEQFTAAGIAAAHLDGSSHRSERRAIVDQFRTGEIKVLSNVDLFGEGFDVPDAEAAILLRPTKSLALFLQQVGRVLRPKPVRALILDHAGNLARHGLPDDERAWSLGGKRDRPKDEAKEPAICPACAAVHAAGRAACPECGHAYELRGGGGGGREIEFRDGALGEIDVGAAREERRVETERAQSLAELIGLGEQRGYRDPETWARHYWSARQLARK